jgi:hypothetical protein
MTVGSGDWFGPLVFNNTTDILLKNQCATTLEEVRDI